MKEVVCTDGCRMRRISRWIEVKHNYNPNRGNSLWDYVEDWNGRHPWNEQFDPANGLELTYFRFRGRTYALEQFYILGSFFVTEPPHMFIDDDGKLSVIGTVDMDGNLFDPIYGEWDEYCERVRLWERVR